MRGGWSDGGWLPFFVTSVFGVFTREAEKIATESRSEKIAAGESGAVRV
jgi:hypothetical protein